MITDAADASPHRSRLRKRLVVTAIATVGALAVAAVAGFAWLRSDSPAPARLGDAPTGLDEGPSTPDGVWTLTSDGTSFVGYRTRERIGPLSLPGETVGRTTTLQGELAIADGAVTAVTVTADMTELRSNTELRDESLKTNGLETDAFPEATFKLTEPVQNLKAEKGTILDLVFVGDLTLHGVTRHVEAAIKARWNGPSIQVAGSIPIELDDFDIDVAASPVFAGLHVDGRGTAEFELLFASAAATDKLGEIETLRNDPAPADPFAASDPACTDRTLVSGAVVFTSPRDNPEEPGDLWKANADGSGLTQLTDTTEVLELDPAASPDGTMIAYSTITTTGAPTVWVMNADGSNPRPLLTAGPPAQLAPAWSPDSSKLVFSGGSVETPSDVQLFVANADGTNVAQLTTSDGRFHSAAAWSSDGASIAYESYGQQGADELFVVSATGGESTRLTDDPGYDSSPEWLSNDTLLFVHDGRLAHMDVATKVVKLGDAESVGYGVPRISPDGHTVLVGRNGNLFAATVEGRDHACLPLGRTADGGDWLPTG